MAINTILLDTNAYSHYLAGDKHIEKLLIKASAVFLSVVVIGELLVGYKEGTKEGKNRKYLQVFMDKPTVSLLPVTIETAEIFSSIFLQLKKEGRPIPVNDLWIAAQTIETRSILISTANLLGAGPIYG